MESSLVVTTKRLMAYKIVTPCESLFQKTLSVRFNRCNSLVKDKESGV